jgi:hypothetical protein
MAASEKCSADHFYNPYWLNSLVLLSTLLAAGGGGAGGGEV